MTSSLGCLLLIAGFILIFGIAMSSAVTFFGTITNSSHTNTKSRIVGVIFINGIEVYRDYVVKSESGTYLLRSPNYFGFNLELSSLATQISKNWGDITLGNAASFYTDDQNEIQVLLADASQLPVCNKLQLSQNTNYQCLTNQSRSVPVSSAIAFPAVVSAILCVAGVIFFIMPKIEPRVSKPKSKFSPSSLIGAIIAFSILFIVVVATLTLSATQLPFVGTILVFIFTLVILLVLIPTIALFFDLISSQQFIDMLRSIEKKIPVFNANFITALLRSTGILNNEDKSN